MQSIRDITMRNGTEISYKNGAPNRMSWVPPSKQLDSQQRKGFCAVLRAENRLIFEPSSHFRHFKVVQHLVERSKKFKPK